MYMPIWPAANASLILPQPRSVRADRVVLPAQVVQPLQVPRDGRVVDVRGLGRRLLGLHPPAEGVGSVVEHPAAGVVWRHLA